MGKQEIRAFKAGFFREQGGFKSFFPEPINREWVIDEPDIAVLLSEADLKLGELSALSRYVPEVDFFIKMHVAKEATTSSRIEGTQTSIEEAVLSVEDISPERRDDWREVQNYINAMNFAIDALNRLPLSTRLLNETHRILLESARGEHKLPGEFRRSQNWIGGASPRDAVFVPPPHTEVQTLMSDLEQFLHNDKIQVPLLIRIAIAHYQFETIHPYLDGNGRLGRLMIPLYLVEKGILTKPTLYLSDFFERNKTLYYDNLMAVRLSNNLSQWIRFFLVGVSETAVNAVQTLQSILKLKEEIEGEKILSLGKQASRAKQLIGELYKTPVLAATDVMKKLNVSAPTANNLLERLQNLGILKEITGYKRNRLFAFHAYLALFQR
jgi:Fic family protein